MNKKNCLFISYDGLSDSLGQSQIMPYLEGISKHPRDIYLLSFEKKNQYLNYKKTVDEFVINNNINWFRLKFTDKFGKIGKIYDLVKLFFYIYYIVLKFKIKILHGRGLIPSFLSVFVKLTLPFLKIKNIFDYRGVWPDERLDNKILIKTKLLDYYIYILLKKIDKFTLFNSNFIIFLTYNIQNEFKKRFKNNFKNSLIIPCCVDYNLFDYSKKKKFNKLIRNKYKIPLDSLVFNYNGSLTGVYEFENMIKFFKKVKLRISNSFFLITSHDENYGNKILHESYKDLINSMKIVKMPHSEIPKFLSIANISISFIKETYARKAMSPTKLAESLALGIPVLYNKNIGDVATIVKDLNCGQIIDYKNNQEFDNFCKNYQNFISIEELDIINKSKEIFDISIANTKYEFVYNKL